MQEYSNKHITVLCGTSMPRLATSCPWVTWVQTISNASFKVPSTEPKPRNYGKGWG